jgi:ATP-dependent Lhr-like helicase
MKRTEGYKVVMEYLEATGRKPFAFQEETWEAYLAGKGGLLNAPTGYGKTFALWLPVLIQHINRHPDWQTKQDNGLQLLWITPLRALAKDIQRAMQQVCDAISLPWQIGLRNGDTTATERSKQKKKMPEVLITTPESFMLLLSHKDYPKTFETLHSIVVDEWHELLGSKRGVQVELALSRMKHIVPAFLQKQASIWAISATIGNLQQALEVIQGSGSGQAVIIKARINKKIDIHSILPDDMEKLPWAGYLGIKMIDKVMPIIEKSNTTLLFTNTRSQSEIWFHTLLDNYPELAGLIALHHGSIDAEMRNWIEEALHQGILKVVVCTASLDLGVDFRPVDTIIQVGSPKGVARFLQRAGRSGHSPDATSVIYFLPTHSLELIEGAALKKAVEAGITEQRLPVVNAFDVLIQYLGTLAVGDGYRPADIWPEVKSTYAYKDITKAEWNWCINFLNTGGNSLQAYDEFKKVEIENGVHKILNRRMAMRHRMNTGTIVSDPSLKVKFLKGGYIGMIEEWFVSRLSPGDVFSLAGKTLSFVSIKDMTVLVRKSNAKNARVPSWMGGRMPLSANLGAVLRSAYQEAGEYSKQEDNNEHTPIEFRKLAPLFALQEKVSHIPKQDELLIESIKTKDGHHLFLYPFEGRQIHEVLGALLAYRLSKIKPLTFSIAMNDYGLELLSDQEILSPDIDLKALFSTNELLEDIQRSINAAEMAKRKFRDIAVISGLIFQGLPGNYKAAKHLQASSSLLFNVFSEHEPDNLLLRQAYQAVFFDQIEEVRLRQALRRIQQGHIVLVETKEITPFSFPIKVDSLRQNLSSEELEARIKKMKLKLLK